MAMVVAVAATALEDILKRVHFVMKLHVMNLKKVNGDSS